MDEVDIRILNAMGLRRFSASKRADLRPASIARRVDLDPTTVRDRINRMEEAEFLNGFEVIPNFGLFGLNWTTGFFDGLNSDEKKEALERLHLVEHVIDVHDFFQGPLCVEFAYRDGPDRARKMGLIAEFTGRQGEVVNEATFDNDSLQLSSTDWDILAALREDALMRQRDIADEIGANVRTVRRRLKRLEDNKAFYLVPRIDPANGQGFLFAGIGVWLDSDDDTNTRRRVHDLVDDYRIARFDTGTDIVYVVVASPSPASIEGLDRAISRTRGVERTETNLLQGITNFSDWIDRELATPS